MNTSMLSIIVLIISVLIILFIILMYCIFTKKNKYSTSSSKKNNYISKNDKSTSSKNDKSTLSKNDKYITSADFYSFMDIVTKKNDDKEFNNYIKIMYNNTITYKQLNYALDKINNNTVANIYKNFLSEEECKNLITYCQDKLQHSGVSVNNKTIIDNKSRSSKTAFFKNALITHIKDRISTLLNINSNNVENIQVTKYDIGDYYKLHHDYIKELTNKRKYSVIIYLNSLEDNDGGATYFPFYNQKIIPTEGTLIYFDNVFDDDSDNFLTLHESQSIKAHKNKYILTTWTRINNLISA